MKKNNLFGFMIVLSVLFMVVNGFGQEKPEIPPKQRKTMAKLASEVKRLEAAEIEFNEALRGAGIKIDKEYQEYMDLMKTNSLVLVNALSKPVLGKYDPRK